MADIKIAKLSDFRFDDENANKGTPRGKELLKKSLKQRKFARPTFAAADGTILGGNKTLEAAQEVGMEDAIVIESDGTKPIIHVRTDIPNSKTPAARKLALEDNRIAELSLSWDDKILGSFAKFDETLLEELWDENEILQKMNSAGNVAIDQSSMIKEQFQVLVEDLTEEQQRSLLEQLNQEGYKCRALIS